MPLLELVHAAQQVKYVPPACKTDIAEYSEEEIFDAALNQALHNPTITYGIIACCRKYAPIKIILKQSLRRYVSTYVSS